MKDETSDEFEARMAKEWLEMNRVRIVCEASLHDAGVQALFKAIRERKPLGLAIQPFLGDTVVACAGSISEITILGR